MLASLTVLSVGFLMVSLSMNLILGWSLEDTVGCPGSDTFCSGTYWTYVADYMPTWLFIGQLVVTLALASPVALLRTGR